ncbi:DUF1828 domain-containing protein [Leuconostoc sp. LN180020]|uniref:DUF1828 domain-containing protein n=1 Tax=Leuconostoc sp. LN180020 TaxID=2571156 RepID=UPI00177DFF8A|nr:DUF1828 domain-containing protein [Leuconostoc sp. LN180020]QOG09612.1 DUF1828 domain-containing protein [Leuconostoc sp. LN180020]
MESATNLKTELLQWVKTSFDFSEVSSHAIRIDTPFLNHSNDSVVLYAESSGIQIRLTDDGYTVSDLTFSGVSLTRSPKRAELFKNQLVGYGVSFDSETNELYLNTTMDNFAQSKFRLVQAILFVDDMFMLRKTNVRSLFYEDVTSQLESADLVFNTPYLIDDSIGMTHKFEFQFPGSRSKPERLVKLLSSPTNETYAKSLVTDVSMSKNAPTKITREQRFFTLIDDTEKSISPSIYSLMLENEIKPIEYSKFKKSHKVLTEA